MNPRQHSVFLVAGSSEGRLQACLRMMCIDFFRVESAVSLSLWQQCLARLQDELSATEFSMWIRPLQAELSDNTLALYAPNRFVLDWVRDKYLNNINGL